MFLQFLLHKQIQQYMVDSQMTELQLLNQRKFLLDKGKELQKILLDNNGPLCMDLQLRLNSPK